MKINKDYLATLNPCKDRFDNYTFHYGDFDVSLSEFLDLPNITHKDKLWVYFRSIDRKLIGKVAANFAESVLHIYEAKYPDDLRPRKAIKAARLGGDSADAASSAASAAYATASAAAAASAAYAAAASADAAYAAVYAAAAAAAAADAAYAAAAAAASADAAYAAAASADAAYAAAAAADAAYAAAAAADAARKDSDKSNKGRFSEELKQIEIMKKWSK